MFTLNNPTKVVEGTYTVTSHDCPTCGDNTTILITGDKLYAYNQGAYVQEVLSEYPAEIRAHANTLAGVHTSSLAFAPYQEPIDDRTSFLLAMNPAGLKLHESCLEKDGILLANSDSFGAEELACAGYLENPLAGKNQLFHRTISVPMAQLTNHAINLTRAGEKGALLSYREVDRCRNLFALGMLLWYYSIPIDPVLRWLKQKFSVNPSIAISRFSASRRIARQSFSSHIPSASCTAFAPLSWANDKKFAGRANSFLASLLARKP